MIIITAYDETYAPLGELCVKTIQRYCTSYRDTNWVRYIIPKDYNRPHSWFKVQAILKALPHTDHVLWIDADALLFKVHDYAQLIRHSATVNIAKDDNGINHGVVAWKNCQEAFCALERIDGMTEFTNHQWWEQAALATIIDDLNVCYQRKSVWNAYPDDVTVETQVLHFPGMPIEERLAAMKKYQD